MAMARLQVTGRQSDVAHELGVSQSVVSRLASGHRTTGGVHDRPRSGAPRLTGRNDDQHLSTYALRHHYATATQLQARLRDARVTRLSRQTIRNRLHHFGLNARLPCRENLAQDHVTWTMQPSGVGSPCPGMMAPLTPFWCVVCRILRKKI
uniref:Transposase Tc1-like domain-containing protein n=1 Tax=Denticeps clupeoides TaxID=299321 RepID=A0AAY4BFH4_9TELE